MATLSVKGVSEATGDGEMACKDSTLSGLAADRSSAPSPPQPPSLRSARP